MSISSTTRRKMHLSETEVQFVKCSMEENNRVMGGGAFKTEPSDILTRKSQIRYKGIAGIMELFYV